MLASKYEWNGFRQTDRQTDRQTTHSKHHFLEPLQTLPLTGYATEGALLSFTMALSAGRSFTSSLKRGVVFGQQSQHRGGLLPEVSKEGWSLARSLKRGVVFHQKSQKRGGLSAGRSSASGLNIRVVFQQGGLSPEVSTQGWSFSNVVFHQRSQHRGGLSAGRSFASSLNTGVVFQQGGLSPVVSTQGWSFTSSLNTGVVSQQGSFCPAVST